MALKPLTDQNGHQRETALSGVQQYQQDLEHVREPEREPENAFQASQKSI